jgi:hypothetical protein
MLSGGVPTSLWYPSLPDKGYSPHPGVPTQELIAGGGPKREPSARVSSAVSKNFLGHFFCSPKSEVINMIGIGTMVEEGMVYSG